MTFGSRWPVVDCHAHVGVSSTCTFVAEEELIPWMDRGGIDVQMIFQLNQGACHQTTWVESLYRKRLHCKDSANVSRPSLGFRHDQSLAPAPRAYTYPIEKRGTKFGGISRNLALEECERIILELDLWGLKMHPREHGFPVNHWTVRHILDKLVALQRQTGKPLIILVHAAADSNYNTPEALADVARDYPDLLFLMAHVGYMWGLKTVAQSVGPCENVLFDLTTCPDSLTELAERYGPGRFVAGSDGPFAKPAIKHAIVESIFQDPGEQALVLGGNLVKRLGIGSHR